MDKVKKRGFIKFNAIKLIRWLVAGISSRSLEFAPGSVHVAFVVDKVALGQVFVRVLPFFPVNIIPPGLFIVRPM
jgi:hypothetical protein